ncbi:MAG: PAS domain-containing protein [Proteobacteria bacterium]|nr:PAS domain-containing protein [Pseudomonadota bacterium]
MTTTSDPAAWLAENLATFAQLIDTAGLVTGVLEIAGDDFRYVSANANIAERFGVPPEQVIGRTGRELAVSEAAIVTNIDGIRRCQTEGPSQATATRLVGGQKRNYVVWLTAAPPGPDGALRAAFVSIDMSARRSAEIEAQRQQARVEAALEAAAMGIWEYDIVNDRLSWDARSVDLTGAIGDPMSLEAFMARVHPDDRDAVQAAQDAAEAGENDGYYRVEHRMRSDNGADRWIESTGRILFKEGVPVQAIGTVRDIAAEVAARERQAFLTAELNHRVKNNLAAVQAIANQTLQWTPDPAEFRDAFQARVLALSRAHDLLNANAWRATDLRQIMERSLEAAAGPVRLQGPSTPVLVLPERAMTLAIIFNELATNAAKHGAHSRTGGEVTLAWTIVGERVEIRWTERGGPAVKPPRRQGFGSRILRAGAGGRDGAARLDYNPDGLNVRLTLHRSPAVTFEAAPEMA